MPKTAPALHHFFTFVEVEEDGCWLWNGTLSGGGYGRFWSGERYLPAHHWSYETFVGAIPEGLVTDHLCSVRRCVRPDHLEAVTQQVNVHRGIGPSAANAVKTHCPNGHAYDSENTHLSGGRRVCRTCARDAARERYRNRVGVDPSKFRSSKYQTKADNT